LNSNICTKEKKSVAEKKYDTVEPVSNVFRSLLPILPTNQLTDQTLLTTLDTQQTLLPDQNTN
jgi:hypothetical protein